MYYNFSFFNDNSEEHFTENIENKTQNNKNQNTKSNIANIDDGKNKDTENLESCDEKVESKTKNDKNKKTKIKKDEINDSQIENAEIFEMENTTEDSEKIEVKEPVKIFDKKLKSIVCSRIPREYM